MRPLLCGLLLVLAPAAATAERATERYAPLQLDMAQQSLSRARTAQLADPGLAKQLARQAELDARIAWGMSDSAALRRAAAEVAGDSAALLRALGERARPRAGTATP